MGKVLSIDVSAVIRKIIRSTTEVLDLEFLEAGDGFEGLKVLEENFKDIALILLDWNMPGMNGLEFLVKIKANSDYKGIPVMMVTTESEKDNIIRAIQAGAINYMSKPFTTEELIKKMMECFGRGDI